jgi:long-subunit fatty acid transport protein
LKNRSQIKRITYLAPTLAYTLNEHVVLEFAIRYSLNGRNFPAGHQIVLGASTNLPVLAFLR